MYVHDFYTIEYSQLKYQYRENLFTVFDKSDHVSIPNLVFLAAPKRGTTYVEVSRNTAPCRPLRRECIFPELLIAGACGSSCACSSSLSLSLQSRSCAMNADHETPQPPHALASVGQRSDSCHADSTATSTSSPTPDDQDQAASAEAADLNQANRPDRAQTMVALQGQLEMEMLKRRPDHFVVAVICRSLGGVPEQLRSSVWKELLGVTRSERLYLDQSILSVEEDLANQKVISADACRTRANDPFFRDRPETIEAITKILTYYCKCRNIRYKQGMNEVLAPFLMLEQDPPMPEGVIFQCFYAMIDKFLPQVFVDREFKSLQCSFQLYRLLMLYHDPKLCHYLDQHDMTPELYVTPWFMTLFARNLQPELVFQLWDFFLLEEDPFLMHFVAYALVAAHRETIFAAEISMLPQVLSNITFNSREQLEDICMAALALSEATPRSFERDLYSVCYGGYSDTMLPFLRQLSGASSLQVYPDELVKHLMNRINTNAFSSRKDDYIDPLASPPSGPASSFGLERSSSSASLFFIVLDCRPLEQYQACHLNLSYHIDPDVVSSPDALAVLLKGFSRMKGCHFCFVGPSEEVCVPKSASSNIASTIARLARNISGDKNQQQPSPAVDAVTCANVIEPASGPSLDSPGMPGSGASDIVGQARDNQCVPSVHYEDISVTRLVLMFLQKGFEHISRLDGGFDDLKKHILSMDEFTREQLLVHTVVPAAPPTVSRSSSIGSTSGGLKIFGKLSISRGLSSSDVVLPSRSPADSTVAAPVKTKPKMMSALSQRLQNFTSAAKEAVSHGSSNRRMSAELDIDGLAEESRLVGEEEWVEVCLRTREALEKSLCFQEVVFQVGPLGILFQKSRTSRKYQACVDSVVPDSQASESQQIERGDLLVSINGQSMADVAFLSVIELVKEASRPLVLRFENPKKKSLETFDAISIPPMPPTLVSASPHSIGISWNKLPLANIRYHLQYAKQSEFNFNPWMSVKLKQDGTNLLDVTGTTDCTNGTLVNLDPEQSLVFRVRCGNGEKWGPYSLSSGTMTTLEKENSSDSDEGVANTSQQELVTGVPTDPIFLPGVCPEHSERGIFYFRVMIALRARSRPALDAEKLDLVLEKGTIIKCTERLVAPGTNMIFVRLCDLKTNEDIVANTESLDLNEDGKNGAWAFENTSEGAVVLERLPEYTEKTTVPFQEQAKSLVTSILSGSGIKPASTSSSNTSSNNNLSTSAPSASAAKTPAILAPRILQVFAASPTSIVVTWDPVHDIGVTRYQIQYAKNRFAAMWWSAKQEIGSDTLKYTVNDLMPNTSYLFRVRGGGLQENEWGPYSEQSESCKTLPLEAKKPAVEADSLAQEEQENEQQQQEQITTNSGGSRPSVASLFSTSAPSSASNNSPPLRTGSTLLDKAVAVASRLTAKRRTFSASSGTSTDPTSLTSTLYEEDPTTIESDGVTYVNLTTWKYDTDGTFQGYRFFSAQKYSALPRSVGQDDDDEHDPTHVVLQHDLDDTTSRSGTLALVGTRELVVTPTSLLSLNIMASKREGFAVVEENRSLESLVKVTKKRSIKNSMIFHFKVGLQTLDLWTLN